MTVLRFSRALYDDNAVDAAVKVYAELATFELAEEADYWVVTIECPDDVDEREVVGELGNYALGLTVDAQDAG